MSSLNLNDGRNHMFCGEVASRWRAVGLATAFSLLIPGAVFPAGPVTVESRRLVVLTTLEERPYSPIVREGELVLPDSRGGHWGLSFFDLEGKSESRFQKVNSENGAVSPLRAGFGHATWWIWTLNRRWMILDDQLRHQGGIDGRYATPVHPPVVLGDRAVVYGFARAEVTGSESAYLYELTDRGECLPILEFSRALDPERLGLEFQWDGKLAGGLGRSPDGGFSFVDPRDYRVYVFDGNGRLKKVIQGANPRWRPPNWSAVKPATPATDGEWWRWGLSQIAPKAPVFLDERHIAVLVGIPKAEGVGQSLELDIYRTDGTAVATAIPVPNIEAAGRLHVAQRSDPKSGDEIVIILEPDPPPYLATTRRPPELWSVTVTIDESTHAKKPTTGKSE